MSIIVTTPTGHVGSRVVRLLLQAGVRPRVLVRDLTPEQPRDLLTTTPTTLAAWTCTHLRPLLPEPTN